MAKSDCTDLSLILSRVMDDIGVNEECILRQRKSKLLMENIISLDIQQRGKCHKYFYFGSQSEAATTRGLHSDTDALLIREEYNVIQDLKDWVLGKINLLMIETEHPGYCKLQVLRSDEPIPEQNLMNNEHFVYDEQGRVVHNNLIYSLDDRSERRNGPAMTSKITDSGVDTVLAYMCMTWPKQYRRMSLGWRPRNWPTPEMIRYIETSGCFVVPTGHRLSKKPELEWRISTSLAERCLMFSLNITQIRCYILLKMIVKTFIEPNVPDVISSYMCKTSLFHCIERTDIDFWKVRHLLHCVHHVVQYILASLHSMDFPNFFNMSANLLLGKLDEAKQKKLIDIISKVLLNKGGFLLQINFDNVNGRLAKYLTDKSVMLSRDSNEKVRNVMFVQWLQHLLVERTAFYDTKTSFEDKHRLLRITINYARIGSLQSEVSAIVLPFYCSYLASLEASTSILRGTELTTTTLHLFKHSLNSDVTSSRLKYASYLYCTCQFYKTLTILEDVEQRISESVMQFCPCCDFIDTIFNKTCVKRERRRWFSTRNIALCVMFRKAEIQCCPLELRCEMFRSTEEDMTYRDNLNDRWMDKAAIQPLPYIYFLKYMTYRNLGKRNPMQSAFWELFRYVTEYPRVIHRETVFNLLGQCMEHDMMYQLALSCYVLSLKVRPRNNAAKWHISRLLSSLINNTGGRLSSIVITDTSHRFCLDTNYT